MEGNYALPKDHAPLALRRSTPARLARAIAVLSLGLFSVQCLQDFAGPGDLPDYLVEALTPEIDTLNVGDTINLPEAKLLVGDKPVETAWRATVIEGADVLQVDSANGIHNLVVLKRGVAKVRLKPASSALADTALHYDFTLHAMVPRLQLTGPDTIYAVGDTIQLTATPVTRGGVTITEAPPIAWFLVGLDTAATLVPDGRVIGLKNGDISILARVDTATVTRVVRVRQRVRFITMAQQGAFLIGGNTTLAASASDAKLNAIANPPFVWSSLNPNVATVNASTGVVTAVASGQTVVAASSGGYSGYTTITVAIPGATAVNLWMPMTSGTTTHLNAIWGFSATNIFATGRDEQSPILQSNGTSWTAMQLGQHLHGLWGTSASSIYAVGLGGKILRYNGTTWTQMTSNTTQALFAIWGASESDIFAVGLGGTIVHYDGTTWSAMTSNVTADLKSIWGRSKSDIFAVGTGGTILRYNGNSWNQLSSGTTQELRSVWGSSAANAYAVGLSGTALQFNGVGWTPMTVAGTLGALDAVWGTSSGDAYVAGESGLLRLNGSTWDFEALPLVAELNAVWGTSNGNVFMVGNNGVIHRGIRGATITLTPPGNTFNASGLTQPFAATVRDGANNLLTGVDLTWSSSNESAATVSGTGLVTAVANGSANICARARGGAQGCVTVTVGAAPVSVAISPSGVSMTAATTLTATARDASNNVMTGQTFIWASLNPSVATVNGSTGQVTPVATGQATISATTAGITAYALVTVSVAAPTAVNLWRMIDIGPGLFVQDVWGASPNDMWAVGDGGQTFRFNGTSWSSVPSGVTTSFNGVWGTGPNNVYAVGQAMVRVWNGSTWSSANYPGSEVLSDVWGSSPNDVWVVGSQGIIRRFNGTSWETHTSGTTEWLTSIWGSASDDIHAAGNNGALLHYDGTSWSSVAPAGYTDSAWDLFGLSSDNVLLSVTGVFRWNGSAWSLQAASPFHPFFSVWGSTTADLWASTEEVGGSIKRFDGANWVTENFSYCCRLGRMWGTTTGSMWIGTVGSTDGATPDIARVLEGVRGATIQVSAPVTMTAFGATQQLTAIATDAASNVIDGMLPIRWTSSDETRATVNPNGLVTAVANGTTSICARAVGGAQNCVAVLVDQAVASVTVTPNGFTLTTGAGGVRQLTATARDANGNVMSGQTFTWASANDDVADVNTTGSVNIISSGQSVISATADGVSGYSVATVAIGLGTSPVNLWVPMTSGVTSALQGIWGNNFTSVFAVGDGGVIRHFDGSNWGGMASNTTDDLRAVWGFSGSNVYAVGFNGVIRQFNGSGWNPVTAEFSVHFGVWGAAPNAVHIGGNARLLSNASGSFAINHNFSGDVRSIWGSAADNVYAVAHVGGGNPPPMFRFNGTSWSSTGLPTSPSMFGIWGMSASHIIAVGESGEIQRWNGTSWISTMAPTGGQRLNAVWGHSATEAIAVGNNGNIVVFDGTNWTSLTSGTTQNLNGIWGTGNRLFVVGDNGLILRGYRNATTTLAPLTPTLSIGETVQLTPTTRDAETNVLTGVSYTWSTTNGGVASVSTSGLVTAEGNGTTTVCATAPGGAQGCTTVTVSAGLAFRAQHGTASGSSTTPQLNPVSVSGNNRLLICVVSTGAASSTTTVNFLRFEFISGGGFQSFTQMGGYYSAPTSGQKWSTWYLIAPSVGAGWRVIGSLSQSEPWEIGCVSYTGVNQTQPFAGAFNVSGAAGPASLSVSTNENNVLPWAHLVSSAPGYAAGVGVADRRLVGSSSLVDANLFISAGGSTAQHTFNWTYSGEFVARGSILRPAP